MSTPTPQQINSAPVIWRFARCPHCDWKMIRPAGPLLPELVIGLADHVRTEHGGAR